MKLISTFALVMFAAAGIAAFADSQPTDLPRSQVLPVPGPGDFLMEVGDVFSISGRGTVVAGKIDRGEVKLNDTVEVIGTSPQKTAVVISIEAARKAVPSAAAGDEITLVLRGVSPADVPRGRVLAKPGSIKAHKKFKAKISLAAADEGGRTSPIKTRYRPMLVFRAVAASAVVTLPEGTESAAPGESGIDVEIELAQPAAMEANMRFNLREGTRTIGSGVVTEIVE